MNLLDVFFYCLGGGLMSAVIFFPLSYLAMRGVKFRRGLGKAWRPFV